MATSAAVNTRWMEIAPARRLLYSQTRRNSLRGNRLDTIAEERTLTNEELVAGLQSVFDNVCKPEIIYVLLFDGAAQLGICGAGGVIHLNQDHFNSFRLNCGKQTNMKAELIAFGCVIRIAKMFGVSTVKVFGDSRVTIKWARGEYTLKVLNLDYWCSIILSERQTFSTLSLTHIYREFNMQADDLSKLALEDVEGYLFWEEHCENSMIESGSLYFLD